MVFDGKNTQVSYATSKDLISFKKGSVMSPNITYEKVRNIFANAKIGKNMIWPGV